MSFKKWFKRLREWFSWKSTAQEYMDRFVFPRLEYALSIGMPQEELDYLWEVALEESKMLGIPPGLALRDLIAHWEWEQQSGNGEATR